jgi:pimeloyl-ACP methyl ester carboxylesterase
MDKNSPLAYREYGSGFPVFLIHGFCESKEIWKDFAPHLSSNFRIICPDLPGFGESHLKKKEISIEYMAEKLRELLDFLKLEKCIMIGHSLGGYVTLAFAEEYEERLRAFGLFHSTAFPDSAEKKRMRNKTIDFVEKHGSAEFAKNFVPGLFYENNQEKLRDTIEWLKDIASSASPEGIIAATKAMRERKSRTDVLKNSKVPVLFIIGEEDPAVPLESSLDLASMPGKAVKHILPDTGHMGMFEAKEETLKIIEEFLMLV